MKKTLMILFALIAVIVMITAGCANPSTPVMQPVPEIVGTWERIGFTWEFTAEGICTHTEPSGDILVYGIYEADRTAGTLYIEQFEGGDSGVYLYDIVDDVLMLVPTWVTEPIATYWDRVEYR